MTAGAGALGGVLLTVAPSAEVSRDLPTLLRLALDSEQVGAGRLHLPADLPDPRRVVGELRAATTLVLTCDPGGMLGSLCDLTGPLFADVVVEPADPADVLATVARIALDAAVVGRAVSMSGRAGAALPVALAAIAGGLHLRVGTADAEFGVRRGAADDQAADKNGRGRGDDGRGIVGGERDSADDGRGIVGGERDSADEGRGRADVPRAPSARPDVALIARAAGLARIAGRAPIRGAAALELLDIRSRP